MSGLLNRAKVYTATTGTSTVTLGAAVVPFQTWASGQPANFDTKVYSYLIEDGTAWEIGEGVFNKTANTLTRVLIASSTGALLNLTGSATVACSAKALDSIQLIEKKVFTGSETSFTFSDIPQGFSSLELEIYVRGTVSGAPQMPLTVNGLTTSIYDLARQYAIGTSQTGDNFLATANLTNIFAIPGSTYPAGQIAGLNLRFPGYSNTAFHKVFNGNASKWPNSTTTFNQAVMNISGGIRTTNAITSIESGILSLSSAFVAGSYALLRGIP